MSVYAKYDTMSKTYDLNRKANGAHLYLGLIYTLTGKPAENVYLLDAGCGTGNHSKYLLEHGLGRVAMFDANEGMLERARDKLRAFATPGQVTVRENRLPAIPYADGEFDAVMFNQVLHHLDQHDFTRDRMDYPNIEASLEEAYRVLKPNGVVLINMSTPHQLTYGKWYYHLFPNGCRRDALRNPEPSFLLKTMNHIGFSMPRILVEPMDLLATPDRYFYAEGPLDEGWRSSDSSVASALPEEIESMARAVHALKAEGKLRDYMLENDRMRAHVGQYSILVAQKKA